MIRLRSHAAQATQPSSLIRTTGHRQALVKAGPAKHTHTHTHIHTHTNTHTHIPSQGVGLGFAVAAAAVAHAANPQQLIVAVEGDSAFGFSGMELESLVRWVRGLASKWMSLVCVCVCVCVHVHVTLYILTN